VVITFFINQISNEALAARTYCHNMIMFVYLFCLSITQGGDILVGHLVGQRRHQAAYVLGNYFFRWSMIITLTGSALLAIGGRSILGAFTDNQEIITMGVWVLVVDWFLEIGRTSNIFAGSTLRATGDIVYPFVVGVIFQWTIAVGLSYVIGIPLGCIAAYRRGGWLDGFLRVITTVGVAIPTFVLATLMLVFFAVHLGWLPAKSNTLPDFKSYIMPVISLSSYYTCYIAKLTRTSMLDTINQDYIRTAKAKGVKTRSLILKHALRNSLIPVITYLGPVTAGIITGSFVVESTFQIPGLGKYFVQSVLNRDYTVIMATTVVLSALVIFMNLVVDLAYKIVDPRITLTAKED
jgi:ABC-type dipeptide/oligopeptide/nickel transport system permease component